MWAVRQIRLVGLLAALVAILSACAGQGAVRTATTAADPAATVITSAQNCGSTLQEVTENCPTLISGYRTRLHGGRCDSNKYGMVCGCQYNDIRRELVINPDGRHTLTRPRH